MNQYPPGPQCHFAYFGMTFRHAFRLWWNPLKFISRIGHTYQDLSFYRFFTVKVYLVNSPELIEQVLVSRRGHFRKEDRQMRLLRSVTGNGLLVTEGDFWLRQRRLLQAAFHPSRLAGYAQVAAELAERRAASYRDGEQRDMAAEMLQLMMEINAKTLFSADTEEATRRLSAAVLELSQAFLREIQGLFQFPDWAPLPAKRRKLAAKRSIHGYVDDLIRQRRETGEDTGDLLSMLLLAVDHEGDGGSMSDTQARDEAITMMIAGNHTSGATLSWLWQIMGQYPEVQERVVAEIEEVIGDRQPQLEDVEKLVYLQQVIKESMRLYPPAWALFTRQANEDVELGGYTIPRDSWLYIYPYVTHRDPRFFADPLKFDPDRFSPERLHEIPKHAYFPFGVGPHKCIGGPLALVQITLVLASMLQQVRFVGTPSDDLIPAIPDSAIRPKHGAPLRIERRQPVRDAAAALQEDGAAVAGAH